MKDFNFNKIEEGKYKLTIISEDEEGTFEQEPLPIGLGTYSSSLSFSIEGLEEFLKEKEGEK